MLPLAAGRSSSQGVIPRTTRKKDMAIPREWGLILSLATALAGAIANTVGFVIAGGGRELDPATLLFIVAPFLGFAVLAFGFRSHGPTSLAVLIAVVLAAALAVFSWRKPFGEWSGISFVVLLLPAQTLLCVCTLVIRALTWRWR